MKYIKMIYPTSTIKGVQTYEGESIERYCERAANTQQPIENTSPIIFTAREDGVLAEHNIKTDKWDRAASTMNELATSRRQTRHKRIEERANKLAKGEGETE